MAAVFHTLTHLNAFWKALTNDLGSDTSCMLYSVMCCSWDPHGKLNNVTYYSCVLVTLIRNQQIWVRKLWAAVWKSLQHHHSCCQMGYFVPVVFKFIWFHHLQAHKHTHTHTHTQTWVLPNNCRAAGTLWQRRSIKKTKKYQSFIFQTVSTLPAKCSSLYKCSTERAFTFLSAAVLSEQVLCCYTGGCLTEIKAATRRASEGRPSRETETTSASWNKIIRSTFFFITDVRVKVPKRGKKHWMHVITSHP